MENQTVSTSSSDSSNWSKGIDIAQIGLAAWNAIQNNQSQREAMLYQKQISSTTLNGIIFTIHHLSINLFLI